MRLVAVSKYWSPSSMPMKFRPFPDADLALRPTKPFNGFQPGVTGQNDPVLINDDRRTVATLLDGFHHRIDRAIILSRVIWIRFDVLYIHGLDVHSYHLPLMRKRAGFFPALHTTIIAHKSVPFYAIF